jgi:threonine dehydratase
MRGATNAILSLPEERRKKGIVTHSSGNFAQAVALACRLTGTQAHIVMPENTPMVKRAAVEEYGANIITSGNTPRQREEKADQVCLETGGTFVHPSDQVEVILGNATAARELLEEQPDLQCLVVPVGGGGLIAGSALAAHIFGSQVSVIGAEPTGADDAVRSLRDGRIYPSDHPDTICDGLRTNLGEVNFPVIREYVEEILPINDHDTIRAMRLIFERMKIVVEPSAAIALAAVMEYGQKFGGKRVGILLSGGNVDMSRWFEGL